jgi:small subunit ribosomal protein S2
MSEDVQAQADGHRASVEELLKAGTHFGHLTSRWNPKMKSYVFMERNGIHIIDLTKSQKLLDEAADAATRFARAGKSILFTGTKKQGRDILRQHADSCDTPYVVERWLGGTLTNFQTIRKSIRRMEDLIKMEEDGTLAQLKKKERLMKAREREKLEKVLLGISKMPRLPGALFVVDINREHIAVKEARKLGIPIIAMVDTNCDPDLVNFPIPANDDALKSIDLIAGVIAGAINEGRKVRDAQLAEEKAVQQRQADEKAAKEEAAKVKKVRVKKEAAKAEAVAGDAAAAETKKAAAPEKAEA